MRTGTPGWYKRINRNYNAVSRSCRLTDAVEIDPSRNCVDRMQAAARAAVLTRKVSGLLVFMSFFVYVSFFVSVIICYYNFNIKIILFG